MGILKTLKQIGQKEPEINGLYIQQIRFHQFVENTRKLLDLFDDGREKALDEYIFDRHYVITLIDRVVQRLGMMVYDACVLVPENGPAFYRVYDGHVLTAKRLVGSNPSGQATRSHDPAPVDTPDAAEPEYQLLFQALDWFNGKGKRLDATVMPFMEEMFSKVTQNLEPLGIEIDQNLFQQGQLASNLDICSQTLSTKAHGRLQLSTFYS